MFKFNSIRTKYVATGIMICLFSIVLVSTISYIISFNITSDLSDKRMNELTLNKSAEFDHWFKQKELIIESLVQDITATGDFSRAYLLKLLTGKMKTYSADIIDIYMGFEDDNRQLLSGVGWVTPPDYRAKTRTWYISAAKSGNIIFTEPYIDAMTGQMVITLAKSLYNNGKLIGVLAADIYISELIKVVNSCNIGEGSYALLLDENGKILVHPDKKFLPTEQGLKYPDTGTWPDYNKMISKITAGIPGAKILLRDYDGNKSYFIFNKIHENNWYFGIAIRQSEYKKPLRSLLIGFVFTFFISTLIGLFVIFKIINSMLIPVKSLTETVSRFSAENMSARAEITTGDEIGALAKTFNSMADTIEEYSKTLECKVELRTRQLEEKNNQIMESIIYARRLQNAILPNLEQKLELGNGKCFSIWRPRNIVGGDMFWCRTDSNKKLLAVADCTGHGVPGALMTMTLSSIIDATVREKGFDSPAEILSIVNNRLKQNLMQNNDENLILDGADIALLLLDTAMKRIIFTGAGLTLFMCGDGKIGEFKDCKSGIGYSFGKNIALTDIEIPYTNGFRYYFTTDGFTDQNIEPGKGGMGKSGFVKFLEKISSMEMNKQREEFEREIDERLLKVPQRDDITIIGIQL